MKLRHWIGNTVIISVAALSGVLLAAQYLKAESGASHSKAGSTERHNIAIQQGRKPMRVRASREAFYTEIQDKSNTGLTLLLDFWSQTFLRNRLRFSPPRVFWSDLPSAFYDGEHHKIYISLEQLLDFKLEVEEKTHTDGDLAYIAIIAHEYGHAVQSNLQLRYESSRDQELQADCLAGAFVAYLRDEGYLEEGDMDEATCMFFLIRDPTGTKSYDQQAHGTGSERVSAFHTGVGGGVQACRCNLK